MATRLPSCAGHSLSTKSNVRSSGWTGHLRPPTSQTTPRASCPPRCLPSLLLRDTSKAGLAIKELLYEFQRPALGLRQPRREEDAEEAEDAEHVECPEVDAVQEHGRELRDDEIADPVRHGADADAAGPVPQREDLGAIDPDNRPEAVREVEDEEESAEGDDPTCAVIAHDVRACGRILLHEHR